MKTYKLIYEDRQGNEIDMKVIIAENMKDARKQRDASLATTKINDLYKIRIVLTSER